MMDLENLTNESLKQLPRAINDERRLRGLPRTCCMTMDIPSTQRTWSEKRGLWFQDDDILSSYNPKSSAKSEERNMMFCRRLEPERTARQSIASTSKDILAMAIASFCVFLIYQHESIPARQLEENGGILEIDQSLLCLENSPKHINGSRSGLLCRMALAMARLRRTKIWEAIASRVLPLITNPPPLLFLFAIIIFALSLSRLLHSQKTKQYRYRNHILGVGIVAGAVVGIWKTEENFLMEGKGYLAGSAVLGLLMSWVAHGVLRAGGIPRGRVVRSSGCGCGCGCD
ncbi:hypothetical protein BKA65DRAFT_302005 [Rhexocercosporidium sp. MPI-PUGE-AT-0058]|nr:hypothetical protein BKA65DRAFT_302005 [Rhexocercosporidium sp. MPI-PUGE-AT-0058]